MSSRAVFFINVLWINGGLFALTTLVDNITPWLFVASALNLINIMIFGAGARGTKGNSNNKKGKK